MSFFRTQMIGVLILAVWLLLVPSARAWDFIVLPPDADAAVVAAVADLADVVAEASGTAPTVLTSRWLFPRNALFVGDTPLTVSALRLPSELTRYGSVSRRGPGGRFYLRAQTAEAVVDGIYGLALEWAGARWYWPGEIGRVVSGGKGPAMFDGFARRLDEPTFIHRGLWPSGRVEDGGAFGRRNRLRGEFSFNHAFGRIFSPELFDQQPELFATRGGAQRRPRGSAGTDPQPHLAAEAVARFAADAALAYFAQNPQAISFSLSINDNILFDDTELTRALVEPLTYFRGKPNYSDLVFTFMNRVARMVFDEAGAWSTADGRARYLTALAYYWAEQSPSFELHPRVVPVLTADRAQWHDPAFRAEDKALIERWGASGAEVVGTWDYLMGGPFPYPRQFNRHIVDSIRHLAANNVDVYFAQLAFLPGWDGIKLHLTSRLLWQAETDAERILDDFYCDFFGAAAVHLRDYFAAFERERGEREGVAEWIKFYKNEAGVELFEAAFLQAQAEVLRQAMARVDSASVYARRIEVVQRDLEFTRTYHRFATARSELTAYVTQSDLWNASAAALLQKLKAYRVARDNFLGAHAAMSQVPYYERHVRWLQAERQSDPTLAALGALAGLGWRGDLVDAGIEDPSLHQLYARLLSAGMDPPLRVLSPNQGLVHHPEPAAERFLFPPRPQIWGWALDLRPTEKGAVSAAWAPQGNSGVRFVHADAASLFTDVPIGGEVLLLLEGALRYRAGPDSRILVEVVWSDAAGKRIGSERLLQLPVDWQSTGDERAATLRIPLAPPEAVHSARIRVTVSRQFDGDVLVVESLSLAAVDGCD